MSDPFKINGLRSLARQIDKMGNTIKDKLDDYLNAKALEIEKEAKARAKVDDSFLKNNIVADTETYLSKTISSNATYSAYVEFGTGPKVRIRAGFEEFAKQFKGERDGNSRAQPFFLPAYFKAARPKKVERDLKKMIIKELRATGKL